MKRSIIKALAAMITFCVGVGCAFMFTALPHTEPVHYDQVQAPEHASLIAPNLQETTVPTQARPEFVLDYNPGGFNPRGDYFILGKKPKDFREFDVFELAVDESDGNASGHALFVTDS